MPRRSDAPVRDRCETTLQRLLSYCSSNNWAGYDPYDALNSKLLQTVPFLDSWFPRLVLTQAFKRSPLNCRRLFGVPKTQNPKGLALFLSSLLKLPKIGLPEQEESIDALIERLTCLRAAAMAYSCWGYSFPWQTRTKVVPAASPNLVCTCFVAEALLDAYEQRQNSQCLEMAVSAAEYVLNDLYWTKGALAGFSYPLPGITGEVHNANFLGAALLCRVYRLTGDGRFLEPALNVTRYSVSKQRPDGSWHYGELPTQKWVDNFHTGYNLCALRSMARSLNTKEFDSPLKRGFEFYRAHFFREDGAARYFHDRTYPIDIHSVAQSIITLVELHDLDRTNLATAYAVCQWAMDHMWDDRGFFYYRILRGCTNRIPYMRWSEAWMSLALATLLCAAKPEASEPRRVVAESRFQ